MFIGKRCALPDVLDGLSGLSISVQPAPLVSGDTLASNFIWPLTGSLELREDKIPFPRSWPSPGGISEGLCQEQSEGQMQKPEHNSSNRWAWLRGFVWGVGWGLSLF